MELTIIKCTGGKGGNFDGATNEKRLIRSGLATDKSHHFIQGQAETATVLAPVAGNPADYSLITRLFYQANQEVVKSRLKECGGKSIKMHIKQNLFVNLVRMALQKLGDMLKYLSAKIQRGGNFLAWTAVRPVLGEGPETLLL